MENQFQILIDAYQKQEKKLQRISLMAGLIKLLLLIAFIFFLWNGIRSGFSAPATTITIILGAGSIPLWICHSHITGNIKKLQQLCQLASAYLQRQTEEWKAFSDTGEEFMDTAHPYSYDLDLFGKSSLFQLLNVTKTHQGRMAFAGDLSAPGYTEKEIKARQAAIGELSGEIEFQLQLQYLGEQIQNRDALPNLIRQMEDHQAFLKINWLKKILCWFPVASLSALVGSFLIRWTPLSVAAFSLLGIQVLTWLALSLKSNAYLAEVGSVKYTLEEYAQMFQLVAQQRFLSPLLARLQKNMGLSKHSASRAIGALDMLVQRVQARNNILLYILLNALFLWDIQCSCSYEKWRVRYHGQVRQWFANLGTVESLCSFSTLCQVITGTCNPQMQADDAGMLFSAAALGHPLIPAARRVCNDFQLGREIVVLSGSNMSGKTTFLRTVGINLVLAKCGCGVCAQEMQFADVALISSMRISDNLTEGISTFYAELKKIKEILTLAKEKQQVLFLIDEIFRGTNSADRTAGAKQVIKKLNAYGAGGLLTTHDLLLCEDFEQIHLQNHHFSEQYIDGVLSFDYRLKAGVAQSTNGRYLMKMLGFYDEA